MNYEELPPEQRPIAGAEDIKDIVREYSDEFDGPVEKAARRYLASRSRRIRIELESGRKADAVLYRLVELFRAGKFAKAAGIEIANRKSIDLILPTFARITIDEPDTQEID